MVSVIMEVFIVAFYLLFLYSRVVEAYPIDCALQVFVTLLGLTENSFRYLTNDRMPIPRVFVSRKMPR